MDKPDKVRRGPRMNSFNNAQVSMSAPGMIVKRKASFQHNFAFW